MALGIKYFRDFFSDEQDFYHPIHYGAGGHVGVGYNIFQRDWLHAMPQVTLLNRFDVKVETDAMMNERLHWMDTASLRIAGAVNVLRMGPAIVQAEGGHIVGAPFYFYGIDTQCQF